MMAYAPRLMLLFCLTPLARILQVISNDNGDTAIPFFYSLHFFVISKLIDRLSEKYVSYLSDVSPARSSHANRVEDSLSLSRVRASMQNALISLPMYRPTGWKYYLGSVPRRMRTVLYRELIYCRRAPENIVSLVKRILNTASKDNYRNYR